MRKLPNALLRKDSRHLWNFTQPPKKSCLARLSHPNTSRHFLIANISVDESLACPCSPATLVCGVRPIAKASWQHLTWATSQLALAFVTARRLVLPNLSSSIRAHTCVQLLPAP